tara:strand:+ start:177 stop:881 length:705 start_codon:yes stop_codon:yes gene_type:complete
MVRVDTVYQRVLAIANKEQRGYITPQEFNLFANQAQMDIFEQYFYDLNQFSRVRGNNTEYSDMVTIIEEKINIFETQQSIASTYDNINGTFSLIIPGLYRMGTIQIGGVEVEKYEHKEFKIINRSPLLKPTASRPVYYVKGNLAYIHPNEDLDDTSDINAHYIRKPNRAVWGYVVTQEKALYNANASTDFELHASEETDLVIKILQLAGITIEDPSLYQIASQEDVKNTQQEKQ